jgi:ribosome-associated toxin RatA of RatAB toxin-antitoxin module
VIESSIVIAASAVDVFDLAQDYELRLAWDPFLRAMRFLDGATEADVGVRVWVRAKNGLAMTVEYITLQRPHSVAMKMTDGPWFFRRFAGSWRFAESQSGHTTATFRYAFETRPSLLRTVVDPVIARVFQRDIDARLRGLKHAAEDPAMLSRLHRGRRSA